MAFTRILKSDRVKADRVNQLGDEISAEILKFSTFDLYLKTGNSMNAVKPTGAGTEILTAVGTTEAKIYNFNYALGAETTISKDNRYSFVLPFTRLDTNKTYTFRYVLKVGANTLINVTKNPIAPSVVGYAVEFVSVNQLDIDFVAPVGTAVTLEVWAKSSIADTEIGLLVNDINTMARTSRNEAIAIVSASGINTVARGFSETQEEFNSWEYLTKAPKNDAEFTGTMKLNAKDVATTETGQVTLVNGWQSNGYTRYALVGAIGKINLRIKDGALSPQYVTICSIPASVAPSEQILAFVYDTSGGTIGTVIINTDGNVQLYVLSTNSDVVINESWVRA